MICKCQTQNKAYVTALNAKVNDLESKASNVPGTVASCIEEVIAKERSSLKDEIKQLRARLTSNEAASEADQHRITLLKNYTKEENEKYRDATAKIAECLAQVENVSRRAREGSEEIRQATSRVSAGFHEKLVCFQKEIGAYNKNYMEGFIQGLSSVQDFERNIGGLEALRSRSGVSMGANPSETQMSHRSQKCHRLKGKEKKFRSMKGSRMQTRLLSTAFVYCARRTQEEQGKHHRKEPLEPNPSQKGSGDTR